MPDKEKSEVKVTVCPAASCRGYYNDEYNNYESLVSNCDSLLPTVERLPTLKTTK